MDLTTLARELLEPLPAHRTVGVEVLRAADGEAEISSRTSKQLTNVIGSLHSSGLIALIDAAGLAAIIAGAPSKSAMAGILPLGRTASVEFLAPARGRLLATAALDDEARYALEPLWAGSSDRARFSTTAQIMDSSGTVVSRGSFDWSVRRVPVGDEG
ncbi:PaaI family thioesterase [Mycobacterium sp. LTG2003]